MGSGFFVVQSAAVFCYLVSVAITQFRGRNTGATKSGKIFEKQLMPIPKTWNIITSMPQFFFPGESFIARKQLDKFTLAVEKSGLMLRLDLKHSIASVYLPITNKLYP